MNLIESMGLSFQEVGRLDRKGLEALLLYLTDSGSSDIYIKSGETIKFKKHGKKVSITERVILKNEISTLIADLKNMSQKIGVETGNKLETDYRIKRKDRAVSNYRINGGSFNGGRGLILTIRAVNTIPLTIEQTEMPACIVEAHVTGRKGIGFFIGDTGSGKSTSIGSLIAETMKRTHAHIITIENPIELIFNNIKGALTDCVQYQIGIDVQSWEKAIESALRENPDFILVGEARNPKTIEASLKAAETGHSVATTIHVGRGFLLFQRVINAFDPSVHIDIKARLINLLNYIVFQDLVVDVNGKLFSIKEYVVFDKESRAALHASSLANITNVLYEIFKEKGQLIHQDIDSAFKNGRIDTPTYKKLLAKYEVDDSDLIGVAA